MDERKEMPVKNTGVWAAYVVGHDLPVLWWWHLSLWQAREYVRRARWPYDFPPSPDSADIELAIDTLLQLSKASAKEAAQLARALERWRHHIDLLLIEFWYPDSTEITDEWNAEFPPGTSDWRYICRLCRELCDQTEPLGQWRSLGDSLSELRELIYWPLFKNEASALQPQRVEAEHVRVQLLSLAQDLDAAPLVSLAEWIGKRSSDKAWPPSSITGSLVDKRFGAVTVARIEDFIRCFLWDGATPDPWITLTPDRVVFLDHTFQSSEFSPPELALLWTLCENAPEEVSRIKICEQMKAPYMPENLDPVVTRLRNKLESTVRRFATLQGWSDETCQKNGAKVCFIGGVRRVGGGPYKLRMNPLYVLYSHERPDCMKPK
jgi:hypothetical protein